MGIDSIQLQLQLQLQLQWDYKPKEDYELTNPTILFILNHLKINKFT